MTTEKFASESGHYYTRAGEPAYEVSNVARGGMRPTRITDAKKLLLVPSVTTLLSTLAKPGLESWKIKQAVLAALTLPRSDGELEDAWLRRVMEDAKSEGRNAAQEGTNIHASIEHYLLSGVMSLRYEHHVVGAIECVEKLTGTPVRTGFKPEKSFSHPLGFGGKCDLHNEQWVIDFKGKEFSAADTDALMAYDDHDMQLAAYRLGLNVPRARCAIVYVSRNHPGVAHAVEVPEARLVRGLRMFLPLIDHWKAKNDYDPSF